MKARLVSAILLALGIAAWASHNAGKHHAQGRQAFLLSEGKLFDRMYATPHHAFYYVVISLILVGAFLVVYEFLSYGIGLLMNRGNDRPY